MTLNEKQPTFDESIHSGVNKEEYWFYDLPLTESSAYYESEFPMHVTSGNLLLATYFIVSFIWTHACRHFIAFFLHLSSFAWTNCT